jgi:hypothetical protein
MAGVDSAGLGEVSQNILNRFSEAEKAKMVKVTPASAHEMLLLIITLRMSS